MVADSPVTPLSRNAVALEAHGATLNPLAAVRHGVGPLTARGELPAGSEFDHFRDVLEDRRRQALAWVGGDDASVFDRDVVESYARWSTAHDVVWGVLMGEGIFTRTRRRKSLVELAERIRQTRELSPGTLPRPACCEGCQSVVRP